MLGSTMVLTLLVLALFSLLADPCFGAAVNKVYNDPGCQNLIAEYRTVKSFSPCPEVTCVPVGTQWVTFTCSDELNSTFEGHPTTAVFYSDGSCNQIREMVAYIDCLSKNFGNVTTSETCVNEGGSSDVVTCASSSHINIPVNLDAGQAKENSATAARVVQTSQILTFVALCIILLL